MEFSWKWPFKLQTPGFLHTSRWPSQRPPPHTPSLSDPLFGELQAAVAFTSIWFPMGFHWDPAEMLVKPIGKTIGKPAENGDLMGFHGIYPWKAVENGHWNRGFSHQFVMFHSYVKLPEGTSGYYLGATFWWLIMMMATLLFLRLWWLWWLWLLIISNISTYFNKARLWPD